MAITFPYDLLAEFPGWSTDFDLYYRQEQSRTASGRTLVKDFGSPLWRAVYQSRSLRINELDEWRARLNTMENGLNTFLGRSTSRCFPIKDPRGEKLSPSDTNTPTLLLDFTEDQGFAGSASSTPTLASVSPNRKEIVITGIPYGYQLSVGDLIQIGTRNLHRVVMPTASADGTTNALEIRPHIWPETMVGDTVKLVRPECRMTIIPGSISTLSDFATGRGSVSFQAIEAR